MPKNYFAFAGAVLAFAISCRENEQPPMAPANGNLYDSPGTRPPRHDDPATGGTSNTSMLDMGPLAESGTGMGGTGGAGGAPIGGAYNASGSRPAMDSGYSPPGPN